ncbi:MAG: hypothetical protein ACREN7_00800 [Candidatus Dormibacteria bacterium]
MGTSAPNVCRVLAAALASPDPGTVPARRHGAQAGAVARPHAGDPAVDLGAAARQAEVGGYRRGWADGQRDAEDKWRVDFRCAVCGRQAALTAAEANRLGLPARLTASNIAHGACARARAGHPQ